MRRISAAFLLVFCAMAAPLLAQEDPLKPSARYNPAIPAPETVLGHKAGQNFTFHAGLKSYYLTLAQASDRVALNPYGTTNEGRTLYLLTITSPANHARIEDIRRATARLSDPRRTTLEEAQQIAATMPTVIYLSYNVHGNESVSSEAAVQVLYELAASEDERVKTWLEQSVIVIDPIVNPDGRDRYVHFFRSTVGKGPNPDRFAAEHREPWPGGRTNHYYFDLNRDWVWQTQVETQTRVRAYRRWNAQVHVDYHEMGAGSTYFFAPPTDPVNAQIKPLLEKWFKIYGDGNARAFDRYGFRYFTGESYDLFYPAYGDSWPSLNGAIGMTYEQAGGGFAGLVVDLAEGERRLTLRDRIERHFTSSLATINTSVEHREARLLDYYNFRKAAIDAGRTGPMQQVFLVPGRDPARIARAVEILARNGIEVSRASQPFDAANLTSVWGEAIPNRSFPEGTYVVDLAQPAGFLARTLLERESEMNGVFFYDVTAWSLPLALGVESFSSGKRVQGNFERLRRLPPVRGGVEGPDKASAYLFSWDSHAAARLLGKLQTEGYNAYVSLKPFKISGQEFGRGTVVVHRENNPESLDPRIRELAAGTRCKVIAVSTQLSEEGIDLGSRNMRFLRKPRIAVVSGPPTNSNLYGALWHFFEQRLDLPFTSIRAGSLGPSALSNYNVLILPPDGRGGSYARTLSKNLQEQLAEWVQEGGVLITMGSASVFAAKSEAKLAEVKTRTTRDPATTDEKKKEKSVEEKLRKFGDREKERQNRTIAGAILRTVVDNTHPLAFGFDERLPVLNRTSPILELSEQGDNVIYYPEEGIKLGGYILEETEKKLAHTAYLIRQRKGQGYVVLFAESPIFRGFWDATNRLLLNAVFFGNVN